MQSHLCDHVQRLRKALTSLLECWPPMVLAIVSLQSRTRQNNDINHTITGHYIIVPAQLVFHYGTNILNVILLHAQNVLNVINVRDTQLGITAQL